MHCSCVVASIQLYVAVNRGQAKKKKGLPCDFLITKNGETGAKLKYFSFIFIKVKVEQFMSAYKAVRTMEFSVSGNQRMHKNYFVFCFGFFGSLDTIVSNSVFKSNLRLSFKVQLTSSWLDINRRGENVLFYF